MKDFDHEVASGLHAVVDNEPLPAPPTTLLLRKGKRARHLRVASTAGGLLAVAGVLAVVVVSGIPAVTTDQPAATGPAVERTSPQVELVAAIANSENISFKLKTTTADQKGDGKFTTPSRESVTESAFDPATTTGYMRLPNGGEIRLINGVKYAAYNPDHKQFVQFKGKYDSPGFADVHAELSASADPERLFQALRDSGAKVTKTGPTGYHFEATIGQQYGTVTMVGDITIGSDKRVAKVAYNWTLKYQTGGFQKVDVTLEFSDYGVPVTVERPANPIIED